MPGLPTTPGKAAGNVNGADGLLARLSPQDRDELLSLSTDVLQLAFDLAGFIDPTPICDGASALIALGRGQWFDAAISGLSMVPYLGDLAKAGKLPKYLRSIEKAVALAERSADAARALLPSMQKLEELLNMLPVGVSSHIDQLRRTVRGFVTRFGTRATSTLARHLPDISHRFKFPPLYRSASGKYWVKQASGRLGVPGTVQVHRSKYAQSKVSGGSGDDAGHLIGDQFGAPGGAQNLSRQNFISNEGKGTWHELEGYWGEKLKSGTGVEVTVRDYIPDANMTQGAMHARPTWRQVEWKEIHPDGTTTTHKRDYMNTHTADADHRPGSRTQQKVPATVPPGNMGTVHPIFRTRPEL